MSSFGLAVTCVQSPSDFEAHEKELPQIFQNLPILLTTDSALVTAGLKIRSAGKKLKLEGLINQAFSEVYPTESYIDKLCFDSERVQVVLEKTDAKTKKPLEYEVVFKDGKPTVKGFDFIRSTEAQFSKILRSLEEKRKKASSAPGVISEGAQ